MSNNLCCQCKQAGTNFMDCQTKVNEDLMTRKQYEDTCQEMPPEIEVDEKEFQRLSNVWTSKGYKFLVNEQTGRVTFL